LAIAFAVPVDHTIAADVTAAINAAPIKRGVVILNRGIGGR
jgi:hypothetical protein